MNKKIILFSAVALSGLMMVMAVAVASVFALSVEASPVQAEVLEVAPAVEVAPVQAEVVPQFEKPAVNYERASYEGGCSYSKTKLQMTQAPVDQVEDAPLAQVVE